MADEPDPETSKQNPTIEDHDLELSLGLRPINTSSLRNLPNYANLQLQDTNVVIPTPKASTLTKPVEQAIRRHELEVKRDLKRKNGFVREEDDGLGQLCKIGNFRELITPPWWGSAGGFWPFQGQNGHFTDGKDGEMRACNSSGSSSDVSDTYHSKSASGGTSSDADAVSHSTQSLKQPLPANVPVASTSHIQPRSQTLDAQPYGCNSTFHNPNCVIFPLNKTDFFTNSRQSSESPEGGVTPTSIIVQPSLAQPKDGYLAEKESNQTPRSSSPTELKGVMGKPPKPNGQTNQQRVQLPQMPCVSATGNGPNGKTVTGFLCKYTKSEVSIVCVCHRATFTPASFVEHAGGVDVEHPLRHIRMVPSALS